MNTKNPKKSNWVWPLIIALVLAFWSVVFALFFLVVLWIMRRDPKMQSKEIPFPSDKDRKRAKGTYTWLLISPFLNVVVLLILIFNAYSSNTSTNEWVTVALIPLLLHLPVLSRLDSNSPFVFRHTQQAILLLALRANMTALALNVGRYPEDGIWLFLLGNGSLWLIGSLTGQSQAYSGTGWWIQQKGEKILAAGSVQEDEPIVDKEIGKQLASLSPKDKRKMVATNLQTFKTGTPEKKKKAVHILSQLGEVEKF